MRICIYIFITLSFALSNLNAQQPVVSARIDSIAILVGEQTKIHLEVTKAVNSNVDFPMFSDTIITGIELVEASKLDTLPLDNNQEQITLDYLITSFDEGLYYIPPFAITLGSDTIFSNNLSLKVSEFPVDTISKQFYDIKPVMQPDFVLADYVYILIIILIILLVLGVIIYFVFIREKKIKLIKKQVLTLPPHVKAFADLEKLKKQKLWQQGKHKEYYTKITDILRTYLHFQFAINAMEMTSDEILYSLNIKQEKLSACDNLQQILKLADLVKFAKLKPLPEENELSYMNAHLFISQTQPEEVLQKAEVKENKAE